MRPLRWPEGPNAFTFRIAAKCCEPAAQLPFVNDRKRVDLSGVPALGTFASAAQPLASVHAASHGAADAAITLQAAITLADAGHGCAGGPVVHGVVAAAKPV